MDLTIHNAILDKTLELVNIGINGDRIEVVQYAPIAEGLKSIDGTGAMISPAFVDPHFHLENALISNHINNTGTLREAIDIAARIKNQIDVEDIVKRSTAALGEAIKNGTLWMRSHTDIDQIAKHQLLDGNVAVKKKFKDVIDIQIQLLNLLTRNPDG
jgi:cytosine deaminase